MNKKSKNRIDLTGQKFGKLTVVEFAFIDKNSHSHWKCKCECGGEITLIDNILKYGVRNCCYGCKPKNSKKIKKNPKTKETLNIFKTKNDIKNIKTQYSKDKYLRKKLRNAYDHMKQRCLDKKNKNYKSYGGRGITICEEWIKNFKSFEEWALNNGFSKELSIDRINNDGNYEPNNCRWATTKVQNNNRRNSKNNINTNISKHVNKIIRNKSDKYIEYNGESKTFSQWCKELNINRGTLYNRLQKGWSIEKSFETPISIKNRNHNVINKSHLLNIVIDDKKDIFNSNWSIKTFTSKDNLKWNIKGEFTEKGIINLATKLSHNYIKKYVNIEEFSCDINIKLIQIELNDKQILSWIPQDEWIQKDGHMYFKNIRQNKDINNLIDKSYIIESSLF